MGQFARRAFLRRAAGLSAAAWASRLWVPGSREAWARTAGTAVRVAGTTLERSILPVGDGLYKTMAYGPGFPIIVRTELAAPKTGREDRRVALFTVLHLTDYQLADAQSPARVEFLDRLNDEPTADFPFSAAQRPQEGLIGHVVEALIRQTNAVDRGPVTGRAFDATVCTGDNLDNVQFNELRWYLTLMDGGEIAFNSGDVENFEGVQAFDDPVYYDQHYWHPEEVDDPRGPDEYKQFLDFPHYPGLLAAAIAPFNCVGVRSPWYSLYGNHDALVQGNAPENAVFETIATGGTKFLNAPPGYGPADFYRGLVNQDPTAVAALQLAPARPVTSDDDRFFVSGEQYIQAHLESPSTPGPVGHGFTEDNLNGPTLYYTFQLVEGVFAIALDTNSPATPDGSIGDAQLAWLEQRLVEVHSRYYDTTGNEVRTGNDDQLVVIFTHHPVYTMIGFPVGDGEQRHGGDVLEAMLHRFGNVVAWVSGHTHQNSIFPRPDPNGLTNGYWDIASSAQIDPPQQARIIELVDNRDGTLSIFTTIVDHAGPPQTEVGDYGIEGLAAIARELSFNDPQGGALFRLGTPTDLNTELVLAAPFDLGGGPGPTTGTTGTTGSTGTSGATSGAPTTGGTTSGDLPATGAGGAALLTGAAAIAAASALRRRGRR